MILWSSDQLSYKSLFELFFKSKETKPQFDFDCVDLSIFTYCFFFVAGPLDVSTGILTINSEFFRFVKERAHFSIYGDM